MKEIGVNHLSLDPLCGAAFLFTNKSRRLIKIAWGFSCLTSVEEAPRSISKIPKVPAGRSGRCRARKRGKLTVRCPSGRVGTMNIGQIEEAAHWGLPFSMKVADGDRYDVPHRDYLFLPPKESQRRTYVVIHNDEGFASVLPLVTITSLTYQVDAGNP
jgi:hypothetical protein